ncbi:MAG TPA: Slp family lipoprotein [Nitrospiraceae bacterium]|nr:Slp family lipoprotein [Nitrospiraceae bacterium]
MRFLRGAIVIFCCLVFDACALYQVFPPEVTKDVDHSFDFSAWRLTPNAKTDNKIQLGGRIIQADTKEGTVSIVAAQLPIVEHPAYGPKDTGKRSGEFTITYQGQIESKLLQTGNRLIVVGTTRTAKVVIVDDIPRSFPTVKAQCLHIWNTGSREIADFPSYGAGYETLEEQTFCASHP